MIAALLYFGLRIANCELGFPPPPQGGEPLDFARGREGGGINPQSERVEFNRDIRPILSQNCFACHGPDRKNPDSPLRLDTREGAVADLGGAAAVVPGAPERSELIRRITTRNRSERMPPAKSGKTLDSRQVDLLRRWIAQGAEWQAHWAFVAPRRPRLPDVRDERAVRNAVDRFVLDRLERERISFSPEASKEMLLRRVTLDLTGLPPSIEEIEAFVADSRTDAYERVVDRLLASPRYGERMAVEWLDAARYADTHGLHVDSHRDMWPWRDWVIRAFNDNLPFDRFTIEQLAGDLLPGATAEQKIASGFNRNHMISYQGSSVPEKVRVGYVVDRVNTTATVWLGLTLGCAQCHDHKFDPITQKEYYGLYAFFNSVAEKALDGRNGNAAPLLVLDPDQDARFQDGRRRMASFKAGPELKALEKEEKDLLGKYPSSMIMADAPRGRETRILERGEYNRPGETVAAGTPSCLPPMAPDLPRNRLGLARWLVSDGHPLTSRVAVNRFWQMVFGTGLVASAEDFGEQGDWPSHPDLLDWLAVEFSERGWDVKGLLRLLVTSAAYRQSSDAGKSPASKDPANRLLSRGPRFRLPAEAIRDGALAAGGLLREKVGGPSVFPYQPSGVWEAVASQEKQYTAQVYVQGRGDALYRRSLYTFWKRLAPPPSLAAFDAPSREVCVVRRQRTNTPLQALVLLNDPTFVEAARALAERTLREASSDDDRLALAFRRVTARRPVPTETRVLADLLAEQRGLFSSGGDAAERLLGVGESAPDRSRGAADLAAWTMVMSAILNLDEAITKR